METISLWTDNQKNRFNCEIDEIMILYVKDPLTKRVPIWWYHKYV